MDTKLLQKNLNKLIDEGLLLIPKLKEDGVIGNNTREAITLFQFTEELEPTGQFDFITQTRLIEHLGLRLTLESNMSNQTKLKIQDYAKLSTAKDIVIYHALQNGITDRNELAMFLAHNSHESFNFTRLEESFAYSSHRLQSVFPKYFRSTNIAKEAVRKGAEYIAEIVYGGRMGNDNPGDGYKYRGRGFTQLTGKYNYKKYGKLVGLDLENNPDLAKEINNAAKIAVAFWQSQKDLAQAGKAGDVRASTKIFNGGTNGLSDREKRYKAYLKEV